MCAKRKKVQIKEIKISKEKINKDFEKMIIRCFEEIEEINNENIRLQK